jgi:hypothetical protein
MVKKDENSSKSDVMEAQNTPNQITAPLEQKYTQAVEFLAIGFAVLMLANPESLRRYHG